MGDKDARAARMLHARDMRRAGQSYAKIGKALGVGASRAKIIVDQAEREAEAAANADYPSGDIHEAIRWWRSRGVPTRAATALAEAGISSTGAAVAWLRDWRPSGDRPNLGHVSVSDALDALLGEGAQDIERGRLLLEVFGVQGKAGEWVAVPHDDAARMNAVSRLRRLGAVETAPAILVRRKTKNP